MQHCPHLLNIAGREKGHGFRSRQPTAAATLRPVLTLKGHQHAIPSVSHFPGGKRMISGSYDKTIRQWDLEAVREVETGTVRIFQGISGRITCIDIPADNTLLASGSWDGTVQTWSLETGKLAAPKISKKPSGVDMSSTPVFWTIKDQTIVTAFSAAHHSVYEFDVTTLETVGSPFKGHTDVISGLALSLDCALLASASDDHTIKLWAFGSRQLLASFHILSTIHHLILSPDSHQLVYTTLDDTNIYICNTPPEILTSIRPVAQVRVCS
ncbi:hypothetical protein CY34DRAFT_88035 [Suillus luteus UH-Slu-Lm8-n1]|uniref:WD40 repeat-like protein n=1 Tax=Suillus luteus UH-Slu-Lm8-n1 TaxID=930992 RepID=A0A0D0APZ0_9AGAM|nr:hypothetical protein CY34DRAFT_88035 [Suillus luteus UH-Slu-Lm8-n1]